MGKRLEHQPDRCKRAGVTDTVSSLIAKLLRDQPRNPTVFALDEAIKTVVSTPVVSTPKHDAVVSTCLACERRRESKRKAMKNWRATKVADSRQSAG